MKFSLLIPALLLMAASAFAATQGTIVDKRDGKKYKTVKIGDQTWMAENLNYEMQDSYCYEDKDSNCSKYGRLYEWEAAVKACPSGWHLPSKKELEKLFSSVGGKQVAGKRLKSKKGWNKSGNGTDAFGFSALPAGFRNGSGDYISEGISADFWSSTEYDSYNAYDMGLNYGYVDASLGYDAHEDYYGFSVRCLKDDNGLAESSVDEHKDVDDENSSVEILVDKRDGKKYKTVKIGNQTWMADNLNYKTQDSYCYEDKDSNCSKYGRLYKWEAAVKACPSGWHLPSKKELEKLFSSVGGKEVAGKSLKFKKGWNKGGNGTDAYAFSALPAGLRGDDGNYGREGNDAFFLSSTENGSSYAYYMDLHYDLGLAILHYGSKNKAFSVRCLKDDNGLAESSVDVHKDVDDENSSVEILVDKRDGKKYKTVKIGNQTWMAENLNYKTQDSYCYEDKDSNCSKYGRLYKWEAAVKACPSGWHLPSKKELEKLFSSVGGKEVAGKKLKTKEGWNKSGNGTDDFGFSALPAGDTNNGGYYFDEGSSATFWSSTEYSSGRAYNPVLSCNHDGVYLFFNHKNFGFSVRCLKD